MDKYYTPKIEEFHVGFEFEYKDHNGSKRWHKAIIDDKTHSFKTPYVYETRVKPLDREDIESFDFEFIYTNKMSYWYEMDFCGNRLPESSYAFWQIFLRHDPKRNIVQIEATVSNGDRERFFEGTIKNKSKLKEILTDIGIIYEKGN